jgi:tetratricopeptide (TPR) repeat protein
MLDFECSYGPCCAPYEPRAPSRTALYKVIAEHLETLLASLDAERLLGDIAAHRDPREHESANASYRQALGLVEELGMRPLVAHCYRGLGMLYATVGQQEPARAALSTAIEMYRAMAMTFWLPQAEATLTPLAAR